MDVRDSAARAGAVDTLTAHGAPRACQSGQVCDSATAPGGQPETRGGLFVLVLLLGLPAAIWFLVL